MFLIRESHIIGTVCAWENSILYFKDVILIMSQENILIKWALENDPSFILPGV